MYVCSSIYAVCIIFIFQRLSSLTQQGSFWLRPLRITAGVALLALGLRPCGVGGSHQLIGPKLWAQRRQGPSWWYSFLGSEDGGRNSYDLWWTCVYFVIIKKKLVLCWFQQDVCCSAQCFICAFHSFLRYNDLFGRGRLLWSSSWASSKEKPSDAEGFWGLLLDQSMSCLSNVHVSFQGCSVGWKGLGWQVWLKTFVPCPWQMSGELCTILPQTQTQGWRFAAILPVSPLAHISTFEVCEFETYTEGGKH